MSKIDVPKIAFAGTVVLVSAGAYLWLSSRSATKPAAASSSPKGPSGAPSSGGTQVPPGSVVPALLGRMLPDRGRVLVVGGALALGIANALHDELESIEQTSGDPVTPVAIRVWDGEDVAYRVEDVASALQTAGLPPSAAMIEGAKPDIVILAIGDYNAAWGPVNEYTVQAMMGLGAAFADVARAHFPNVLWIAPWNVKDQPFATEMQLRMGQAALTASPGKGAMLVPKSLSVPMENQVTPTADGYREIAREIAQLVLRGAQGPAGATPAGALRCAPCPRSSRQSPQPARCWSPGWAGSSPPAVRLPRSRASTCSWWATRSASASARRWASSWRCTTSGSRRRRTSAGRCARRSTSCKPRRTRRTWR
jgi:hypothetical protein